MGVCFSQNLKIAISYESAQIWVGEKILNTLKYSIANNEKESYYLWLDKDCSQLNDSLKIRKYFKINPPGGDGCLFLWMCDLNVEGFTGSIHGTFVKIIHPAERFDFIFTLMNEEFGCEALMDIESCLNIVSRQEMIKQFPGSSINIIDNSIMLYEPDYVVLPWKYLKDFIDGKER